MKRWEKVFIALYMDPPEIIRIIRIIRKIIRIWPTVELNEKINEKE